MGSVWSRVSRRLLRWIERAQLLRRIRSLIKEEWMASFPTSNMRRRGSLRHRHHLYSTSTVGPVKCGWGSGAGLPGCRARHAHGSVAGQTVPGQLQQPTERPTTRWMVQCFPGDQPGPDSPAPWPPFPDVAGLEPLHAQVLHLPGPCCEKLYKLGA